MKYAVESIVFEDRSELKIRKAEEGEKNRNTLVKVFKSLEAAERYMKNEMKAMDLLRLVEGIFKRIRRKKMLYVKKPVVIEAAQWFPEYDNDSDVKPYDVGIVARGAQYCKHCGREMGEHGRIETLEGEHVVCPGDMIITGVKGEKYPCKPDIFEVTYSKCEQ
jgi:hypothetical protein